MGDFPKVYVTASARRTGKLSVLRELYAAAVARGEHVHWYSREIKVCRNGTPSCPYWKEEP